VSFKVVNHVLVLHQLDLQVLVRLIVVGKQVVDALKQGSQGPTIVFLFEKELLLGENLDQIHQSIASFSTKRSCIGCQIGDDGNDGLVDRLEQSWSSLDQFVDRQEDEVVVGDLFIFWHVELDGRVGEGFVESHGEFARGRNREHHEDAEVHQVRLGVVLLAGVE